MRAALATACLLPVLMTAGLAHAGQDEENKLRQQLRTVVLQLRELQDAQGALQAKAAAAIAERDTAKKEAAAAKARVVVKTDDAKVDALTRQVTDLQAASAEAGQRAQQAQAETQRLQAAFAEASRNAESTAADRDRMKAEAAKQASIAQACRTQNTQMSAVAEQILHAYAGVGVGDLLIRREPVVGLKRVQFENDLQKLRDGIDGARCDLSQSTANPVSPPPK